MAVTRPGGSQPEPPAAVRRAVAGGCAAGLASGWNISNTGAVAQQLAASYGVGLATVGLFATALFVTHLLLQMPAGRASDRLGERRVSLAGIALIVCFNAVALATPDTALALAARALTGVGTGISFVSGSAYVRVQGGSPFAQGLFGGVALAGGGLALAIVPPVESAIGWRAPYATAVLVGLAGALVLAAGPGDTARTGAARAAHAPVGVFRDARLYRLAVLYAASLGLSIVIGNWVVTLLHRHGGLTKGSAGLVGALTLTLGIATRPLGGWILRERPERTRIAVAGSLVAGALGTAALAAARPTALAVVGAALVGLAAGIPFAPSFTGAALTRPDAPATAVGFVNSAAALVALAATPLVGLTFSGPGGGRLGFGLLAAAWGIALVLLPSAARLGARGALAASEP
ncbi:MAG TPA: MFS transporter [Gaiellaceae bacterium]|nr:MFS transporter [Gaiellaceae bacterium]